jgi:hypothetical protein
METIRCVIDHSLVFLDESKNSVRSWVELEVWMESATSEFSGFALSGGFSSSNLLLSLDARK